MEIKKPPTLQESSTPPAPLPPLDDDWLHEIKQWYFTGSRRLAQERQPARFVVSRPTETSLQDADPEVGNRRPD
jgi:hypothetical protein